MASWFPREPVLLTLYVYTFSDNIFNLLRIFSGKVNKMHGIIGKFPSENIGLKMISFLEMHPK